MIHIIGGVNLKEIIKRGGEKEPFNEEKIKKSIENAVKQAGFNVEEKKGLINDTYTRAIEVATERDQIQARAIRNEILNYLQHEDKEVATAWENYEEKHDIKYSHLRNR